MSDRDVKDEIIRELYQGFQALETKSEQLKEEIDSLQVVSQHLVRPWWRDGATLVASMAFIFSLGTTVFSFVQSENTRIGQAKSELRGLIVQLNKNDSEESEISAKYKNPITLATYLARLNNERGVVAYQASEIAKDIEGHVTNQEHLNIGKALAKIDAHVELAEMHYTKAVKLAKSPHDLANAYLWIGRLKFNKREYDADRVAFSKSLVELSDIPDGWNRDGAAYYNAQMEMFWAGAEGAANFCDNYRIHVARTQNAAKLTNVVNRNRVLTQLKEQQKLYCNSTITNNSQIRQATIPQIQQLPQKVDDLAASTSWVSSIPKQRTKKVSDVSDCPISLPAINQESAEKINPQLPPNLFLGKFHGEIKGDSNGKKVAIPVQVKLVRKNHIVTGAYLRQNVCGTVSGKLEKSILKYRYFWNGHKGNGIAEQKNDVIYARDGNDFASNNSLLLALHRTE